MNKKDIIINKLLKISEKQNYLLKKLAQNSSQTTNIKDLVAEILKKVMGNEFAQLVTASDSTISGVRQITVSLGTNLQKSKEDLFKNELSKHFTIPVQQIQVLNAFKS